MTLGVAIKAFMKAWREPEQGQKFVEGVKEISEKSEPSHLRLLAILQQTGRLIDFLKEDITQYSDAQVGAAARKIHADCGKSLEELVTIRPVREESEGSVIRVLQGYDANTLKVVGKVKGEPPYSGVLVHKGWKAHKRSLPKKVGEAVEDLICPAEVEVK